MSTILTSLDDRLVTVRVITVVSINEIHLIATKLL